MRPSRKMTEFSVRDIVERFKGRREWIVLGDVRKIVEVIEDLLR